jgi:hypothetical protein
MLLLAYIVVGHPDWEEADISVFAAFPGGDVDTQREKFIELIEAGRIPVLRQNVRFHTAPSGEEFAALVPQHSSKASLVMMGLTQERLRDKGVDLLTRYPDLGEVLFVVASERVLVE